ncbi:MAG TPA: YtxH domain-containing protein [Gemmatimonadales bacterium]
MTSHNRRIDDLPDPRRREGRRPAATLGTLLFATALGVGLGLLAAPEPGVQTRKRLRQRLSELSEDFGEGLEEAQEVSGRARKRVRKRLAQLSEDLGEALEEAQELGGKARKGARDGLSQLRKRGEQVLEQAQERYADWAEEEEEEESGSLGSILAVAAGIATTYFLTSDRTATARIKVKEAADTVRHRATDEWDRFKHRTGPNGHSSGTAGSSRSETAAPVFPSNDAPQAS